MAQNTLEILIKANAKQAASEIKKLDSEIGKFGATSGKGIDVLKSKWSELDNKLSSPAGMKSIIGTAGAVAGALIAAGAAAKKLADDYMNYAFQVQDFARIIGETPEEASKLIQVADDVRLSVDQMTIAMKNAVSKGYTPNMQGLMKLADEYNAIQSPIERTRFAMEVFGQRAGPQMAKLLEKGSAAIQQMGDSIVGTGRYMTAEGVAKAEAYYAALDDLDDAVTDVTLTLGGEFAPAIANVAKGITDLIKDVSPLVAMFGAMQQAMELGAVSGWNVVKMFGQYMSAAKSSADITNDLQAKTFAYAMGLGVAGGASVLFNNQLYRTTEKTKETDVAETDLIHTTEELAGSLDMAAMSASKSASNLSRMAGAAKGIPNQIDMKLNFQLPDITSEISNWVKSAKWSEAGGQVVSQFFNAIKGAIANLPAPDLAAVGSKLAALELAVKVKIGEISPAEAAQQLAAAFPDLKGGAPMAEITAALAVDPTSIDKIKEYLKTALSGPTEFTVTPAIPETSKAELKAAIDNIEVTVKPVVGEGVRADLMAKITAAVGGEIPLDLVPKIKELSTAELDALYKSIAPTPIDIQVKPVMEQSEIDALFASIDAATTVDIVPQMDSAKLAEILKPLQTPTVIPLDASLNPQALAIARGEMATPVDAAIVPTLDEIALAVAKGVMDDPVNGPLVPKVNQAALRAAREAMSQPIMVTLIPRTQGGSGTGDKPGPRPPGGRGATGLNMIVPAGYPHDTFPLYASSGERVLIQTPSQQTNSNVTNITNNYYVTAPPTINIRQLAREVTREQQRAGVT